MVSKDTITANIASCSESLSRLRQYLADCRLYEAADDAYNAHVNIQRISRQYDESIDRKNHVLAALQRDVTNEKAATQDAQRQVQILQGKLDEQEAVIADHRRSIECLKRDLANSRSTVETESTRKYREGYNAGVAVCRERIDSRETTIKAHVNTIGDLRKELEATTLHSQTQANRKFQDGYSAGFTAGQRAARPPVSLQQQPVIDFETRMSWMTTLLLSGTSPLHLSPRLKQAIVTGNKEVVASILSTENAELAPPALHLAALFGDLDMARLLLTHGIDVNGQCTSSSDKSGHRVHGVTPMHLAIGTQHEGMIKLLRAHGASFKARPATANIRTSAPPLWLINNRWLTMSGKDNANAVVKTLKLLESLGWDVEAGLNKDGEKMEHLVRRGYLGEREGLRRAVLAFLSHE